MICEYPNCENCSFPDCIATDSDIAGMTAKRKPRREGRELAYGRLDELNRKIKNCEIHKESLEKKYAELVEQIVTDDFSRKTQVCPFCGREWHMSTKRKAEYEQYKLISIRCRNCKKTFVFTGKQNDV